MKSPNTLKIKEKPITHIEKGLAALNKVEFDRRCEALQHIARTKARVFEHRMQRLGVKRGNLAVFDVAHELVSRELGFDSWEHLKSLEENEKRSIGSIERAAIAAAYVGNSEKVQRLCDFDERVLRDSPSVSIALGNESSTQWVKKIDTNERMEPLGWHALSYACCVRSNPFENSSDIRRSIAMTLIEAGADPSVGCLESDTLRGFHTVLGGAIGLSRDHVIVQALLANGASIDDGPTLYEGSAMWYAVNEDDVESMRMLLLSEPPEWHLCHALPHAIDLGSNAMTDLLLGAGADPKWDKTALSYRGGSLHEAIVANGYPTLCRKLVEAGASLSQHDTCGRTPLSIAVALNRTKCTEYLTEIGASMDECNEIDRWFGACFAEDSDTARSMTHSLPPPGQWRYEDHLWLRLAASRGSITAMQLMLEGGINPNAVDYDGFGALHCAAMLGHHKMCKLLVDAGADTKLLDFSGRAPVDIALEDLNCDEEMIEVLGGISEKRSDLCLSRSEMDAFEEAASAIPSGDVATLKRICSGRPHFAGARSPRPHRCTLLNYVGVNGFEGERQVTPSNVLEIMEYLIDDVGCDARALTYTYRGGPGNDTVGLLTSSGHPREQGLTMAMTHKLAKAGAELSEGWKFLVDMQDNRNVGKLNVFLESADMSSKTAVEAFIESSTLGDTEFVRALLSAGMDPNATLWGDVRAIHQAAINGNRKLVELLLARGADPTLQDAQFDGTAAGWAHAGGHEELAKWIWERINKKDEGS
ncbi:MAG: hypothetical protein F4X44_02925 [Gammaproteobacteria bacterium]|nr:hypothetical protein [Gammaproteobacteria bacterium]MYD79548.1 hypothetical protein [Gammaproteobacteria bacterium]